MKGNDANTWISKNIVKKGPQRGCLTMDQNETTDNEPPSHWQHPDPDACPVPELVGVWAKVTAHLDVKTPSQTDRGLNSLCSYLTQASVAVSLPDVSCPAGRLVYGSGGTRALGPSLLTLLFSWAFHADSILATWPNNSKISSCGGRCYFWSQYD